MSVTEKVVGILGGGQLGRMLSSSASLLNIPIIILDKSHSPAKQILNPPPSNPLRSHVDGSFTDPAKIRELVGKVDVVTVEIEHVDVEALEGAADAAAKEGREVEIHPAPETIRTIQDKFRQKEHLQRHGCPLGAFISIDPATPVASIQNAIATLGLPLMLKSRTLAYDGRGNFVLRSADEGAIHEAIDALGGRELYAEKWVEFEKEVAVMVVRSTTGEVVAYPAVETVHRDNICHLVFAPLHPSSSFPSSSSSPSSASYSSSGDDINTLAQKVAVDAIKTFTGAGVYAVEMFLLPTGTLYINEIAPRPHNSGHYTIEACYTSQYENHLRAILGLPLGSTEMKVPSAAMLNVIGGKEGMEGVKALMGKALGVPGASVHLYGKEECREGRKMGHITIVGDSEASVRDRLRALLSPSDVTLYTPPPPPPNSGGHSHPFPLIGIIMGSDSDLPTLLPSTKILETFGIPYELTIVSAHRTPLRMVQYAKEAKGRGLRVIIAGAGGAAHLPGMVAALTEVPVVGVPVKGSMLGGVDSLLSIVQMPRGVPVATVSINNATNAALLAVRILSTLIPRLADEMGEYMKKMEGEVEGKVEMLEEVGWERYVVGMGKCA